MTIKNPRSIWTKWWKLNNENNAERFLQGCRGKCDAKMKMIRDTLKKKELKKDNKNSLFNVTQKRTQLNNKLIKDKT